MRHPVMIHVVVVGIAGSLGAITRYLVGHYAAEWLGQPKVPVGTLVINVSASFLLGLCMTYYDRHAQSLPAWFLPAVATGFIGTYSTFSTLMWEVHKSSALGDMLMAAAYLCVSVILGLLAVQGGVMVGRAV